MPECDYCEESFDGEEAYLEHLQSEHKGELGPIERRRIGTDDEEGDFRPDRWSSGGYWSLLSGS